MAYKQTKQEYYLDKLNDKQLTYLQSAGFKAIKRGSLSRERILKSGLYWASLFFLRDLQGELEAPAESEPLNEYWTQSKGLIDVNEKLDDISTRLTEEYLCYKNYWKESYL